MNPRIDIDLNKLRHNACRLAKKSSEYGIQLAAVTKVFCGIPEIAEVFVESGIKYLADSRIQNLIKMKNLPMEKILLRLPMISEAKLVVTYADISLNSEIETIKTLNGFAGEMGKVHKIILMIDLGDLREGIFDEKELEIVLEELKPLSNIQVIGVGTNLTCFGGVIPDGNNLGKLIAMARKIEDKLNIQLEIISGGNSSSVYLVEQGKIPQGINQLRLGEAIILGTESAYGERVPDTYDDVFTLSAEIIEIKKKPSVPVGEIGRDAFGNIPVFEDRGIRKRAILAVGKQDLATHPVQPVDSEIYILGGSSDHLIVDVTDCQRDYQVGDEISFKLSYGALLALMTSEYVYKNLIK